MRNLLLAMAAAAIMTAPLASAVKAEDTTVIKRDSDGDSKTVIKKEHDIKLLPVPHEEEHKTVIKKDYD